ncbi:hypothetical protein OH768_01070 [Streptomyces sp. NBC_01622]|uniref:hypothetical protein n=1 Tax=Streptomyces sp. NBC_01622 TaxID=2975903 RepID=UPI00386551BC|nr:hypothetical protein OH768_01070 [Streptomyces sp. NBC_01622]
MGTDYEIADTMTSCVANYVAEGDPNGPGLPAWYGHARWTYPGCAQPTRVGAYCPTGRGRRPVRVT